MSRLHAAIDLGASSGRIITGEMTDGRLCIQEIHRFPNIPLESEHGLIWNLPEILQNISAALDPIKGDLASLGVDGWGVDYLLLDDQNTPVHPPFHYRNHRTLGVMDQVQARVPRTEIFAQTGIQSLPLNTLYQLFSHAQVRPDDLKSAQSFLMLPDYVHHVLSGGQSTTQEYTNATTTQFFNPVNNDWATDLLDSLLIPTHFLPKVVQPGTPLGEWKGVPIVAPATHDTASAVFGAPTTQKSVWISSGTWSIVGTTLDRPVLSPEACNANFTNEGSPHQAFRLSKNVMGLWLLQQSVETWRRQGSKLQYADLSPLSLMAKDYVALFDPDHASLLPPGDMPARVSLLITQNGFRAPTSPAETVRAIHLSLALKYRSIIHQTATLSDSTLERIHIFGGGSQDAVLNQLTADVTGLPVVAGPVEATAIGNLLCQIQSCIGAPDLDLLRSNFQVTIHEPHPTQHLEELYQKFLEIIPCQGAPA